MRTFLLLFILLLPLPAGAAPEELTTMSFGKVIDGATIEASGVIVALWGVAALDASDPASFAAGLYLKSLLAHSTLTCADKGRDGNRRIMHCYSDGEDIGSLLIQFGLARASDPYYQGEEDHAKAQARGTWRHPGKSL